MNWLVGRDWFVGWLVGLELIAESVINLAKWMEGISQSWLSTNFRHLKGIRGLLSSNVSHLHTPTLISKYLCTYLDGIDIILVEERKGMKLLLLGKRESIRA